MPVIAFSDPNDVLSYRITDEFVADYLDSRLCTSTVNVSIAVVGRISLPGASYASPELAHTSYEDDEQVLALMADGLGAAKPPAGCSWLRTAPLPAGSRPST